jgi:pseudaminic acid cytidylyltransferase
MSKNICIIPARGGSKRIPRKNIKPFCDKPIIAYSIETALKSNLFQKVIVSTEDDEIANISKQYGAEILKRPLHLADDFTSSGKVVKEAIKQLKEQGESYDFVCTIYATAPFLKTKYLIKGYEELKNSDACNSFSVTSMPFPIQRTFKIKNNRCEMFTPQYFFTRSQDLEEAYQDAAQFYWYKQNCKCDDIFFGKCTIPIKIPRYLVQDIDTPEDFIRAEYLYKAQKLMENEEKDFTIKK